MSESRTKLEQILELLLAEDNAKAEEMLHEYVVSKARTEYERVLDEAEEEVEETVEEESFVVNTCFPKCPRTKIFSYIWLRQHYLVEQIPRITVS